MKMGIKAIAWLLLILILTMGLLSCRTQENHGNQENQEEQGNQEEQVNQENTNTENPPAEAPKGTDVTLYKNGRLRYNVVLPKKPTQSDEEMAALIEEYLEQYTGEYPGRVYADASDYREDERSILVGEVEFPEVGQALESVASNEYAVRAIGNKLVLAGHYPALRELAAQLLLREIKEAAGKEDGAMTIRINDDLMGRDDRFSWDFPKLDGGVNEFSIDNENQTLMLSYTGVSKSEFLAYGEQILADGYGVWQENQIGENLFRTYRQGDRELTLSFYPDLSGGTLHLFFDEHKETVAIPDAAPYEKIREAALFNISFDYSKKILEDGYGMSYVIALEDGRFIVIDGGHGSANGGKAYERLYQCLRENNARTDGIVIAAWFMSHPHGDHYGAFSSFVANYKDEVRLEAFVANPYSKDMNTEGEWFQTSLPRLLTQMNTSLIKPHTGQILTFCNTELEVIFTHENLYPQKNFGANDASTVLRMHQNGHTVLFSADSSAISCNRMAKLYGEELKSDVFQVNHHGHSGGTWEFYDLATHAESYVLWTCPEEYFYYRTLGEYVEGKSSISKNMLKPNRDLALKVGFERNFYAEGIVEVFTFPEGGAVTVSEERDLTRDPQTYSLP